jgi:hypothetical protein
MLEEKKELIFEVKGVDLEVKGVAVGGKRS